MKRLNLALAVPLPFLAACGSDTTKDTTDNGGTTGGETGGTTGRPAAQLAEPLAVQPVAHGSKALPVLHWHSVRARNSQLFMA